MEEKAEKNLLMLCEENKRQQEKLWELNREILLEKRKRDLNETLDRQVGFSGIYASLMVTQTHLWSSPLSRGDFPASVACRGTILCILKNNISFLLRPVMLCSTWAFVTVVLSLVGRQEGEAAVLGQRQRLQWLPGQGLGMHRRWKYPKPHEHPALKQI